MLKTNVVKGVLGVSAVAALFAALAVQAQSGTGTASGATGTGQSTSGQSTGQTGAGQGAGGQSGSQTGSQSGMQSGAQSGTQSGAQAGSSTASGSGAAAALGKADQKMIKDMAMANLAEIEAGRMAQSKSQSEQVKNFAQQMIDDHTRALTEVQQLAQTKGVALPTELDRTHKRAAERMGALSGEAFDRAYMRQSGLADHKKTHALLQQAQSRAKDPDVKALAARTAPIVDQHLNSAQQLNKDTARGSSGNRGSTGSSSPSSATSDKQQQQHQDHQQQQQPQQQPQQQQ